MLIIELAPQPNGAHRNQTTSGSVIPPGWASVPPELEGEAKVYLPFIALTIEDGQITGVAQGVIPEPEPEPEPTPQEQIAALKAQLDATDYQIIKASEYQMAGLEPPYDLAQLHAQRQAIRDQINALEADHE